MTEADAIVFYDISSPLEPRSYAPNPSKARLALRFKRVPFKTTWVDIPDIPDVRKGLNCPAVRKLDDGSDYYTLPVLQNLTSGHIIGDSFDIACYLEDSFPESGNCLFPPSASFAWIDYQSPNSDVAVFAPLTANCNVAKHEAYARFNTQVDTTFSAHVALFCQYLPFNPSSAEIVKATFVKRAHLSSWQELCIDQEARVQLLRTFKVALSSLAQLFMRNEAGPYLEGKQASYADLIVGGWLNFISSTLPKEEWLDFRTWHGGVFALLHDTLQEAMCPLS